MRFLLRLIVNAIALVITAYVLPGIHVNTDIGPLLLVALIFGIVNALVKPVITVLSCPLILITLGLFYLVVNGLMLLITDELAGGNFDVDGLGWAILGGIVLGLVGMVLESLLGLDDDKREVVVD
jgi:putative membrane protein